MSVDFEQFEPLGVDYGRWEYPTVEKTGISPEALEACHAGLKRVYASHRMCTIDNQPEWDPNPPVGEDEASLLHFAMAFSHEAEKDHESAILKLSLVPRRIMSDVEFEVSSGEDVRSVSLLIATLDNQRFFRVMVPVLECAYGVPDEALTAPSDEWQAKTLQAGRWTLEHHVPTPARDGSKLLFSATKTH